nr:PREDICTED: uncharacterized protein LOC105669679 [Linepithema humile]
MPQLPIDKKIILQREDTLSMDLKDKSQSIVVMDKDIPVLTLNSQNSHGVECENPINFTTLSEEKADLILVKLEQIRYEIRNLKAIVMYNEATKTTDNNYYTAESTGFLKTYNIKFPLETNDQFNAFNTQLNTDRNLKQSFIFKPKYIAYYKTLYCKKCCNNVHSGKKYSTQIRFQEHRILLMYRRSLFETNFDWGNSNSCSFNQGHQCRPYQC